MNIFVVQSDKGTRRIFREYTNTILHDTDNDLDEYINETTDVYDVNEDYDEAATGNSSLVAGNNFEMNNESPSPGEKDQVNNRFSSSTSNGHIEMSTGTTGILRRLLNVCTTVKGADMVG